MDIKRIIDFVAEVSPDTKVLSTSCKNTKEHLRFVCGCGKEFIKSWDTIWTQKKCLCNSCSKKDGWKKYRRSELFCDDAITIFEQNGFMPLEEITDVKSKIFCEDALGFRGKISLENVRLGKHFGNFSLVYNEENLLHNLNNFAKINQTGTIVIDYHKQNRSCEILIDCVCECGEHFVTNIGNFTTQRKWRCSKCTGAMSTLEKCVEIQLKQLNINYILQKRFDGCRNPKTNYPLPFDFYCPDNNLCIEVDGPQHEEPIYYSEIDSKEEAQMQLLERQEHDRIKNEFCFNNNIKLCRIPNSAFHRQNQKYKEIIKLLFV